MKINSLFFVIFLFANFLTAQVQVGQTIAGEAMNDYSGNSVALSADGTRLAIGSTGSDDNGMNSGDVRVYDLISGTWVQVGNDIVGEAANDEAGYSVFLSGDGKRVAISSVYNNDGGSDAGHLRIFEESGGNWTQIGGDLDGDGPDEAFGFVVAMSSDGKRVAASSPYHNNEAGQVKIFEETAGAWIQIGNDIYGDLSEDYSGWTISLSSDGKRIAIGSPGNETNGVSAGQARVFEEVNGSWVQVALPIYGLADETLGRSVALSSDGKRVVVGCPIKDGPTFSEGAAKVFEEINGTWIQIANTVFGNLSGDAAGWNVGISGDGKRIVLGAPRSDKDPSNSVGSNEGSLRIFNQVGANWIEYGTELFGQRNGDAVSQHSISTDGKFVAFGGVINSDSLLFGGIVKVFGLDGTINVEDLEGEVANFQVQPNPTDGQFNIVLPKLYHDVEVEITNAVGQLVANQQFSFTDLIRFTLEQESGVYFVNIKAEEGSLGSVKLVKL